MSMSIAESYRKYQSNLVAVDHNNWFSAWFDSMFYHKLYAHRDDQEAARFIDAILTRLQPEQGSRMLDLGCGAGRHAKHLASKGYRVTGLDIAGSSIEKAKQHQSESLHFHQHDMRVPFGHLHFDYLFNFFTSFGYFENEAENDLVMRNMSNSLKHGGIVTIDYMNVTYSEKHLVPNEIKMIDDYRYKITRWTTDKHFFKRIEITDLTGVEVGSHTEKVAKLTLSDFEALFVVHGIELVDVFGDYQLGTYGGDSSRLVLVGKKGR